VSLDAYEFRCGATTGTNRTCGQKVGTANRTEWGYLDFEGDAATPFDDEKLLRFHCSIHGDGVYYIYDLADSKVVMVFREQ